MLSVLKSIEQWGLFTTEKRPFVISGPCSAENPSMILDIATSLKNQGVSLFRAGAWKPRTRPNSFEGAGDDALLWLNQVQAELGMRVALEVASAKHAEKALNRGIDVLWIGARTSTNPFMVSEIAQAIKGVDIPVLIKNPVNPDADLWLGAIERLALNGQTRLAAVHRGFSSYTKLKYRNNPYWQIPAEIKRRVPNLSIICDPSHIAGKKEYVSEIALRALSLGFDGLMIEVHNDPINALSDASQQITPLELSELLKNIELRETNISDSHTLSRVEELRHEIDVLDSSLVDILASRMQISERLGEEKRKANVSILQTQRWNSLLESILQQAEGQGLDRNFIERIYKVIHEASIERQK